MRSAWFVVGLALASPPATGQRRARHGARARRRDGRARRRARGRHDRDRPLDRAGDRGASRSSARSVRAVWFGIPGDPSERLDVLDGDVDEAFSGLGLDGPRRSCSSARALSPATSSGSPRSTGWRRTSSCARVACRARARPSAARCCGSVGAGRLPNVAGLRLVAGRNGDASLDGSSTATSSARRTPRRRTQSSRIRARTNGASITGRPPAPLVVAEGRTALASRRALARTYRTYAWVWPVNPGQPAPVGRRRSPRADGARTRRARERSSSFDVDAPVEELRAAQRAADVAGNAPPPRRRRGRGAAARLHRPRRSRDAARSRGGAAPAHVVRCPALAAGAPQRGRERRRRGRRSPRRMARRDRRRRAGGAGRRRAGRRRAAQSVLSPRGLGLAAATALAAAALVWITVSLRLRRARAWGASTSSRSLRSLVAGGRAPRRRRRRGPARARPRVGAPAAPASRSPRGRGRDSSSRGSSPRSRAGGPIAGAAALAARLAAVGLARGPGAAVATVAFLTIAFALALLAEGYRATLSRADREQAAFQVPLDVMVRENLQNLVPRLRRSPARPLPAARRRRRRCSSRPPRDGRAPAARSV